MNTSNTPAGDSRSLWNDIKSFLVLGFSALLLCFTQAPGAWAEEHVITIYFAGTGTPENAWDGANSAWKSRSLVPVLYNHDAGDKWNEPFDPAVTQHKIHIAGVGTKGEYRNQDGYCNPLESVYQRADPHDVLKRAALDDIPCRTWQATVDEALKKFKEGILDNKLGASDTANLNVVGHSRGAIAVLMFLHDLVEKDWYTDQLITQINAIVLEPVPGIDLTDDDLSRAYRDVEHVFEGEDHPVIGWHTFKLSSDVAKLIAIYSLDERGQYFDPIIPHSSIFTDTFMFTVRGSHQTMVGNKQISGHDPRYYKGKWKTKNGYTDDDLLVVYNLVGITVMRLLHGSDWGGVDFNNIGDKTDPAYQLLTDLCPNGLGGDNWLDGDSCKSDFLVNVFQMHHEAFFPDPYRSRNYKPWKGVDWLYWDRMRGLNYVPYKLAGWEAGVSDCEQKRKLEARTKNRCIMRIDSSTPASVNNNTYKGSLEVQPDIPLIGIDLSGEDAWLEIVALAEGDYDKDGVTDDDDNCPFTPNTNQDDGDNDDQGDACDPEAFILGDYSRECTSPLGAMIQLTGSGSDDPDDLPGDLLDYEWSVLNLIKKGKTPTYQFSMGETEAKLTVTDVDGYWDSVQKTVSVADNQPPSVSCPEDVVAECISPTGAPVAFEVTAQDTCDDTVTSSCNAESGQVFPLRATTPVACFAEDNSANEGRCDFTVEVVDTQPPVLSCPENFIVECTSPDGAPVDFSVTAQDRCADNVTPTCDAVPGQVFPLRVTTPVACSARDGSANEGLCGFTVETVDTIAPVMTGITKPILLWPPNHKYVTFTIPDFVISVEDTCTVLTLDDLIISQVTSNEPDNGEGDGNTVDDIVIAPDGKSVDLRNERQGKGKGRIYTIDIQAVDGSENITTMSFEVQVKHDKKKK